MVNLILVHSLLAAADEQPYGFLKVCGTDLTREVELLASAGLVEASPVADASETAVVIKCVTDSGHVFLRAFRNLRPAPEGGANQVLASANS